jgi:hypothetical protein
MSGLVPFGIVNLETNKAISWKDFTVVVLRFARHNHILVLINRLLLLLEIT